MRERRHPVLPGDRAGRALPDRGRRAHDPARRASWAGHEGSRVKRHARGRPRRVLAWSAPVAARARRAAVRGAAVPDRAPHLRPRSLPSPRSASTCCSATPASCPSATPPTSAWAPTRWPSSCKYLKHRVHGGPPPGRHPRLGALVASALFGCSACATPSIFFGILTMALSQVLWSLAFKFFWVTGGTDGLRVPTPHPARRTIASGRAATSSSFLSHRYYFYVLAIFVICVALMWVIVHSPFGKALQAIRDNETRAEFVGVQVWHYRWVAFLISGHLHRAGRRRCGCRSTASPRPTSCTGPSRARSCSSPCSAASRPSSARSSAP